MLTFRFHPPSCNEYHHHCLRSADLVRYLGLASSRLLGWWLLASGMLSMCTRVVLSSIKKTYFMLIFQQYMQIYLYVCSNSDFRKIFCINYVKGCRWTTLAVGVSTYFGHGFSHESWGSVLHCWVRHTSHGSSFYFVRGNSGFHRCGKFIVIIVTTQHLEFRSTVKYSP